MARFVLVDEEREITDPAELTALLDPLGVTYEKWEVEDRVAADASDEEILRAYAPEIERLKTIRGYVKADVVNVDPSIPGLDDLLAKFSAEHIHPDDEVRFTVAGNGIFYVRSGCGAVLAVHVEAGDLLNVPAGTQHWFEVTESRTIRCIRLFNDPAGWACEYVEAS